MTRNRLRLKGAITIALMTAIAFAVAAPYNTEDLRGVTDGKIRMRYTEGDWSLYDDSGTTRTAINSATGNAEFSGWVSADTFYSRNGVGVGDFPVIVKQVTIPPMGTYAVGSDSPFYGSFTGSFTGNGSQLTNLPAGEMVGKLPGAVIPDVLPAVSGENLTDLLADNLIGLVPQDTLSPYTAYTNTANTWAGDQIFTGDYVGVQTQFGIGNYPIIFSASGLNDATLGISADVLQLNGKPELQLDSQTNTVKAENILVQNLGGTVYPSIKFTGQDNTGVLTYDDTIPGLSWSGDVILSPYFEGIFMGDGSNLIDINADSIIGEIPQMQITGLTQALAAKQANVGITEANETVAFGARDIEVQDATKGLVLKSPDGTRWRITVSDTGTLSAAGL